MYESDIHIRRKETRLRIHKEGRKPGSGYIMEAETE